MKKLILFVAAFVTASGVSAYAQSEHGAGTSKHRRLMSSHASVQNHQPGFQPAVMVPPTGYYGGADAGYGRMDDPSAEGRSGGG
ncbi:hypothetical protein [Bradyrhizobium prioriisuperbiae]|uniref:hypothetical protein n=1 Tax=Bradyrhizobium prioriisuperbiae TaxID=2854389 RepID=UPI0028ECBEF6|nr:hypothetical protein [Bradyrhizobium prioritasuperba]